jgi:ubiquinone/menaquinone biosynthesis C-methylase UbiE
MLNNSIAKPQPHVCPHQIAFFLDNWVRRLIQPPGKIVGPYIQEGNTVIDMGCGPGYFTIDMAKMVGPMGRVIAVDIQAKMLARVRRKAQKHAVAERIDFYQAGDGHIRLNQRADFILAFYMLHEVPDMTHTLKEMKALLNIGGRILAVEPKMHVSKAGFKRLLDRAEEIGLKTVDLPKKTGGRSVVWSA